MKSTGFQNPNLRLSCLLSFSLTTMLVESVSGTDEHDNSKGQHGNQVESALFLFFQIAPINEHYTGYL